MLDLYLFYLTLKILNLNKVNKLLYYKVWNIDSNNQIPMLLLTIRLPNEVYMFSLLCS